MVPELQALDMRNGSEIMRFLFPTNEHPDGLRVKYKGKDVARLVKEFGWRKRERGKHASSSSSAAGSGRSEEPSAKIRKTTAEVAGRKEGAGSKTKGSGVRRCRSAPN